MKKLIFLLYPIFLSAFSFFSYGFIDPNLAILNRLYSGFAFSHREFTSIFYVTSAVIFFLFYALFIYLGSKRKVNLNEVIIILSMTVIILLFSYPAMLSYDIFNYVATSKVLFFYHENPYIVMPIELIGDPMLAFMHAANKIALYGPGWIILTGVPYYLGFGNLLIAIFSFKLFIVVFYALTVFLLWKFSKNLMTVILFSLNPLVIIESLVSGHNDIVMIFLTLFSFYLLRRKKLFFAVIFLFFSILIKYSTIFLLPIIIYTFIKIIKRKELDWKNIFTFSAFSMFAIFMLSPLREEIYPWYAIWFLPFVFLSEKKKLVCVSLAFSIGLLLRYIPYMFFGNYSGFTPALKEIFTFMPPLLVVSYYLFRKLCGKAYCH